MLPETIDRTIEDLSAPVSMPWRLALIDHALQVTDAGLRELALLQLLDPSPDWTAIRRHCGTTRKLLARAPSRQPVVWSPPARDLELPSPAVSCTIDMLTELSSALALALVSTAEDATNPVDEICCRSAALTGAALHTALLNLPKASVRSHDS
ncbi:hypothetical protein ACGFNU_44160 [Spirillospora sp. NPDC048911]|uniref:hypothetical protein n=1 Tax=Spirillospora sp. NPDC048911 TaxID=3364527 RepID=UPI0037198B3A